MSKEAKGLTKQETAHRILISDLCLVMGDINFTINPEKCDDELRQILNDIEAPCKIGHDKLMDYFGIEGEGERMTKRKAKERFKEERKSWTSY